MDSADWTVLKLVSGLLHDKRVQTFQVPPTVVLLPLLTGPEHDQSGVATHLGGETDR